MNSLEELVLEEDRRCIRCMAADMLDTEEGDVDPVLLDRLYRANDLCRKVRGRIASRQIVALAIVAWQDEQATR